MKDQNLRTADDLAAFVGAGRSAVSNWLNGYNFPTVPTMATLIEKRRGLTLDWIYLGIADAVPMALAIKLQAFEEGMEVPLLREEPEAPRKEKAPTRAARRRVRKKAT